MTNRTAPLSTQVPEKLRPIFSTDSQVEDIIITSGRAGAKSSVTGLYGVRKAMKGLTAVVFMRKNHNKLKNTVYKECLRAFTRLGVSSKRVSKATVSPMLIKINQTKSTIYFTGSDNPDDTKGMIDESAPIEAVIVDEVTEFFKMGYDRGKEELDNIKATFIRGNDEIFKMFYMFNPPRNPKDPVMKWLEEKKYMTDKEGNTILNPRTLHIHLDYRDLPPSWLGKRLIESALETKRIDEEYYNWLWLGMSVGVKDVIYHMFDEVNHVTPYQRQSLQHIGVGIDYGTMNPTTFNAYGIDKVNKRVQGIMAYEHNGREHIKRNEAYKPSATRFDKFTQRVEQEWGKQKSPSEYALDFREFIEILEEETRQKVQFYTLDPSASYFREEIQRLMPRLVHVGADNSVAKGIGRVQKAMYYDALVLDPRQHGLIKERGVYTYDHKSIERGMEVPLKTNDHHSDGERYYIMAIWKYVLYMLPKLKEKEDTT